MNRGEYRPNTEIMPGEQLPPGIFRYAACIEYDGSNYHGWQKLADKMLPTVQGRLEQALCYVANSEVTVVCAGRTDTGVHATNQIVHFDTAAVRDERAWKLGANTRLPPDVRIRWIKAVPPQFHARFSARQRTYRYIIANTDTKPAIGATLARWEPRPLDVGLMREAASVFIGEHDFNALRSSGCQARHPVRTVKEIQIATVEGWIITEVTANAFLHHMIRNLMGILIPIGLRVRPVEWAKTVLEAKDRQVAGITDRACGLYLVNIGYDDFTLPVTPKGPFVFPDRLQDGI